MQIEINDIEKLSFNVYIKLHWSKKKQFKDKLRLQVMSATRLRLNDGYNLTFHFEFKGKKLDTINVVHYCKIIEDVIFKQDKDNKTICINVTKGKKNKVLCFIT